MENNDILISTENGMLKIVLNRPAKKNAINISMYKRLTEALHYSIRESHVYAVILTGTGSFFSSGNDFSSALTEPSMTFDVEDLINGFRNFVDALITYPKLLIAIVNGPAIGIAVTMLPLFDIVYTSDTAYFVTPFTSLGLCAEGCSTYTFPKIFGHSKASDMLYLGYKMTAFEAKQYGLVSEVYKHGIMDEALTYLKKLSQLSSESILATKLLVKRWNEKILLEVNVEETNELLKRLQSSDFVERYSKIILNKHKM